MSSLFVLPDDIKQEFSIDERGKAYASQSAIARLCGVTRQAINQLLDKILSSKNLSESLQPFAGNDYTVSSKLPDLLVAAIVNHYAFYARKTTTQAKKVCLCFQAIGFRVWAQKQLGWQEKPTPLSVEKALELANFGCESAQNAGVSIALAESIKLGSVIQLLPEAEPLLLSQKKAIASSNPIPEKSLTPTEIGQIIASRLGLPKISARAVNKKLLQLGYQVSIKRIKKSTGKEVHDYYQPTQKAIDGRYSQLEMATYKTGDGNSTKYQLRWFSPLVDVLIKHWSEK